MKSEAAVTIGCGASLVAAAAVCLILAGYVMNIVALCKCDFEPSYKAETIRTVGVVIPVVGAVTGYIDIEDGEPK
jgi:hypothetical protein